MLFNESVPESQFEIDPTFLPQNKRWIASILGFKGTGERNTFGKISRFIPGVGPGSNYVAQGYAKGINMEGSDFQENVAENLDSDWAGTKTAVSALGAAAGVMSGNPQLAGAGAKSMATNLPQALKNEVDISEDWSSKWFQHGGEISPPTATTIPAPIAAQHPWVRIKDPTWDDLQKWKYQQKLIRQQQTPGMIINPTDPSMVLNAPITDNPDNLSRSMLNMILPAVTNSWKKPAPMPSATFEKGGNVMKNKKPWWDNEEDIIMVDKETGAHVGDVSYGERIMDKKANVTMEQLAKKKDYEGLGKYVAAELQTHDDADEQLVWKKGGKITVAKAKMILRDGKVRGKDLTERQKKFFGFIAGGGDPDEYKEGGLIRQIKQYQDGGDVSGFGIPEGPTSSPDDSPGGFDWSQLGGPEQLFNIMQFVTGIMGATKKLPEYNKPEAWTKFLQGQRQRSLHGMSNAERSDLERQNRQALTAGQNFAAEKSGGNSSFAVSEAAKFSGDFMENATKLAVANEKIKEDAVARYGNALMQDIAFDKDAFDRKYKEDLLTKTSAAALAKYGLDQASGQMSYQRNYGKNSLYAQQVQANIDLVKKMTGVDYTKFFETLNPDVVPGAMTDEFGNPVGEFTQGSNQDWWNSVMPQ